MPDPPGFPAPRSSIVAGMTSTILPGATGDSSVPPAAADAAADADADLAIA